MRKMAFQPEAVFAVFSVLGTVGCSSLPSVKVIVDVHSLTAIDRDYPLPRAFLYRGKPLPA